MICPMLIVVCSLALIVLMCGLFLLAYYKKEGLGIITKITSYIAITFGIIIFVGGLICATFCSTCCKSKCEREKMECHRGMKDKSCRKESCSKDGYESCHEEREYEEERE